MAPVTSRSLRRLWLPWIGTVMVLCVLPALLHLYFTTSSQHAAMTEKALLLGRTIEQIIGQRPLTWEFETHRLEYLIAFQGKQPYEAIRIQDSTGAVIAGNEVPSAGPLLVTRIPLHDGMQTVGTLEIERSLIPILPQLAGTALISLLLGGLIYVVTIRVPLREVTALTNQLSRERDAETLRRQRAEEQLERARKLEAIATMASGMAHFINNMLTPITMFGGILRTKAAAGSRDREMLDRICQAAERATAMVASVLAFGRTSSLQREPIRVEALVGAVIDLVRYRLPARISLNVYNTGDCGWISVDAAQAGSALHNLLNNAVDALGDGSGTVTVSLSIESLSDTAAAGTLGLAPDRYACIRIADNGPGMPPLVANRAFEPFFTTKDVGKGTGLGLYTTHEIVRAQGGAVTLDTQEGKGTTVSIYLPSTTPP